jgi:hypothetical protein
MKALRGIHDAFTFLLELAMLAGLACGGYHLAGSPLAAVLLAVALPAAVIVLWGFFLAPRAAGRLRLPWLQLLRFLCFETAAVLLWVGGEAVPALILGLAALLNLPAAFYFDSARGPADRLERQ